MSDSLLTRTVRAAGWVIAWRWGMRILGMVSTLILVRLLQPADFGLVALAAALMETVDGMMMLGTEEAVIRQRSPDRDVYDTAFTLNVLRGGTVTLIMLAAAVPAAGLFDDPRMTSVMLIVGLLPVIDGLSNIGTVDFRRDMTFEKEFAIMVVPKFLGIIVTLGTALLHPAFTALLFGIAVNRGMRLVMSYVMHPFRPRWSLRSWRVLINYSAWTWALSLAQLLRDKADMLLRGRFGTPALVGVYAVGAEVAALPTTELVEPLGRASFAGFASARRSGTHVNETLLRLLGVAAVIVLPAGFGLSVIAQPLLAVALGPAWLGATPVLQILAIAGVVMVFGNASQHLLSAYGFLPRLTAIGAVLRIALLIGLIPTNGIEGAAWAVGASILVEQCAIVIIAFHRFDVGWGPFLGRVCRPALATLAMVVVLAAIGAGAPEAPGMVLARAVIVGCLVYTAVLLSVWGLAGRPDGAEADLIAGARRAMRR